MSCDSLWSVVGDALDCDSSVGLQTKSDVRMTDFLNRFT